MLYQFQKLNNVLDTWGFPKIKTTSGFQSIRTDFRKAFEAGKIDFRDDGIYLIHEGREWKGYMYMPTYKVAKYGQVSRFHLKRCSVIDDFITSGMFKTYYQWSNNKLNDITDRDTGIVYKEQCLQLCNNCRSEIIDSITDTEDFFDTLEKSEQNEVDIEVDIFGYVRGKERISKEYRRKRGFVCESCSISPKETIHKRFWHTHHIDGDKTNNKESNLECLCILCHSSKDIRHEENFDVKRLKYELNSFIKLYKEELIRIKNPFLNRINKL